jgi:hypothetical protein
MNDHIGKCSLTGGYNEIRNDERCLIDIERAIDLVIHLLNLLITILACHSDVEGDVPNFGQAARSAIHIEKLPICSRPPTSQGKFGDEALHLNFNVVIFVVPVLFPVTNMRAGIS